MKSDGEGPASQKTGDKGAHPTLPRARRACRVVVLAAGGLTALTLGLAVVVDRFGQVERAVRAPAIVVLGARVLESGLPSPTLRARVEKAVELYKRGFAPLLLFSGGIGAHPPAEAIVSRDLAVQLGVPVEACLVETASHSTRENAQNSSDLLRARGITEAVLVSDPYHLLRARQYFLRYGIRVHPSPALRTERNASVTERVYWTLREAAALLTHPTLWTRQ